MKIKLQVLTALTTLFFCGSALLSQAMAQDADGFVTLNGKTDLGQLTTKGNWQVQADGSIKLTPRDGESGWTRYDMYLWAPKKYKDFIFDFEFMYEAKGNSGFYFHCADKKDPVKRGIEVQIKDDFGKEELGPHDMGGIIKTVGPSKNACKPAGEWNRMIVKVQDKKIKVTINGEVTTEFDLRTGKTKDRKETGWIGIQDHGLPFSVRNLRVKEL